MIRRRVVKRRKRRKQRRAYCDTYIIKYTFIVFAFENTILRF